MIIIEKNCRTPVSTLDLEGNSMVVHSIAKFRPRCYFYPWMTAQIKRKAGLEDGIERYRTYDAEKIGLLDEHPVSELLEHPSIYRSRKGKIRVYVCAKKHKELMAHQRQERAPKVCGVLM